MGKGSYQQYQEANRGISGPLGVEVTLGERRKVHESFTVHSGHRDVLQEGGERITELWYISHVHVREVQSGGT